MSALQCAKKLYFEVHHRHLEEVSAKTLASFESGHRIGALARELYATPDSVYIDYERHELDRAQAETTRLIMEGHQAPIFEATFQHEGVLVRVDVLLPVGESAWRIVEVKGSTKVKPHHISDCAVQTWVCRGEGLTIGSVALAHVDTDFVYAGGDDYRGLLAEEDLTDEVEDVIGRVPEWLTQAREAVAGEAPNVPVGGHCNKPYDCGFFNQCWPVDAEYPVHGLGGWRKKLGELVQAGYRDIRDVPAEALSGKKQPRIHAVTSRGEPELLDGAARAVSDLGFPRYYLDFETVSPAIPIWPGTWPYAQIPIQWSLHVEQEDGSLVHREFLDLSGEPPMRALAEELLEAVGESGPILMYTNFEERVLRTLGKLFPDLKPALLSAIDRLWDLAPVVEEHYYHPAMLGSWSIKAVMPTIPGGLDYKDLEEIQEGTAASKAFLEAIDPGTTEERREYLRERLLEYCKVDTDAMVRLVHFLAGREQG